MDTSVRWGVFDPESSQSLKEFFCALLRFPVSALTQLLPSQRAFADVELELLVGSQEEKSQITEEYPVGFPTVALQLLIQQPELPF